MTGRRSERHSLDLFSLFAGIAFLVVGAFFMIDESAGGSDADLGWLVAALLIGLGLAGALGSFVRPRRAETTAIDNPDPGPEPAPRPEEDQPTTGQEEEVSP